MEVVFKKHVHACFSGSSSEDVWLFRVIEMPPWPPVGLEVVDDDWNAVIESLCWAHGKLYAYTAADMELYNSDLAHKPRKRTIQEIVAEYVEQGWEISKDGVFGD